MEYVDATSVVHLYFFDQSFLNCLRYHYMYSASRVNHQGDGIEGGWTVVRRCSPWVVAAQTQGIGPSLCAPVLGTWWQGPCTKVFFLETCHIASMRTAAQKKNICMTLHQMCMYIYIYTYIYINKNKQAEVPPQASSQ